MEQPTLADSWAGVLHTEQAASSNSQDNMGGDIAKAVDLGPNSTSVEHAHNVHQSTSTTALMDAAPMFIDIDTERLAALPEFLLEMSHTPAVLHVIASNSAALAVRGCNTIAAYSSNAMDSLNPFEVDGIDRNCALARLLNVFVPVSNATSARHPHANGWTPVTADTDSVPLLAANEAAAAVYPLIVLRDLLYSVLVEWRSILCDPLSASHRRVPLKSVFQGAMALLRRMVPSQHIIDLFAPCFDAKHTSKPAQQRMPTHEGADAAASSSSISASSAPDFRSRPILAPEQRIRTLLPAPFAVGIAEPEALHDALRLWQYWTQCAAELPRRPLTAVADFDKICFTSGAGPSLLASGAASGAAAGAGLDDVIGHSNVVKTQPQADPVTTLHSFEDYSSSAVNDPLHAEQWTASLEARRDALLAAQSRLLTRNSNVAMAKREASGGSVPGVTRELPQRAQSTLQASLSATIDVACLLKRRALEKDERAWRRASGLGGDALDDATDDDLETGRWSDHGHAGGGGGKRGIDSNAPRPRTVSTQHWRPGLAKFGNLNVARWKNAPKWKGVIVYVDRRGNTQRAASKSVSGGVLAAEAAFQVKLDELGLDAVDYIRPGFPADEATARALDPARIPPVAADNGNAASSSSAALATTVLKHGTLRPWEPGLPKYKGLNQCGRAATSTGAGEAASAGRWSGSVTGVFHTSYSAALSVVQAEAAFEGSCRRNGLSASQIAALCRPGYPGDGEAIARDPARRADRASAGASDAGDHDGEVVEFGDGDDDDEIGSGGGATDDNSAGDDDDAGEDDDDERDSDASSDFSEAEEDAGADGKAGKLVGHLRFTGRVTNERVWKLGMSRYRGLSVSKAGNGRTVYYASLMVDGKHISFGRANITLAEAEALLCSRLRAAGYDPETFIRTGYSPALDAQHATAGGGSGVDESDNDGVEAEEDEEASDDDGSEASIQKRTGGERTWQPGMAKYRCLTRRSEYRQGAHSATAATWRAQIRDDRNTYISRSRLCESVRDAESMFEEVCVEHGLDPGDFIRMGYNAEAADAKEETMDEEEGEHDGESDDGSGGDGSDDGADDDGAQDDDRDAAAYGPRAKPWEPGMSKFVGLNRAGGSDRNWSMSLGRRGININTARTNMNVIDAEKEFAKLLRQRGLKPDAFIRPGYPGDAEAARLDSARRQVDEDTVDDDGNEDRGDGDDGSSDNDGADDAGDGNPAAQSPSDGRSRRISKPWCPGESKYKYTNFPPTLNAWKIACPKYRIQWSKVGATVLEAELQFERLMREKGLVPDEFIRDEYPGDAAAAEQDPSRRHGPAGDTSSAAAAGSSSSPAASSASAPARPPSRSATAAAAASPSQHDSVAAADEEAFAAGVKSSPGHRSSKLATRQPYMRPPSAAQLNMLAPWEPGLSKYKFMRPRLDGKGFPAWSIEFEKRHREKVSTQRRNLTVLEAEALMEQLCAENDIEPKRMLREGYPGDDEALALDATRRQAAAAAGDNSGAPSPSWSAAVPGSSAPPPVSASEAAASSSSTAAPKPTASSPLVSALGDRPSRADLSPSRRLAHSDAGAGAHSCVADNDDPDIDDDDDEDEDADYEVELAALAAAKGRQAHPNQHHDRPNQSSHRHSRIAPDHGCAGGSTGGAACAVDVTKTSVAAQLDCVPSGASRVTAANDIDSGGAASSSSTTTAAPSTNKAALDASSAARAMTVPKLHPQAVQNSSSAPSSPAAAATASASSAAAPGTGHQRPSHATGTAVVPFATQQPLQQQQLQQQKHQLLSRMSDLLKRIPANETTSIVPASAPTVVIASATGPSASASARGSEKASGGNALSAPGQQRMVSAGAAARKRSFDEVDGASAAASASASSAAGDTGGSAVHGAPAKVYKKQKHVVEAFDPAPTAAAAAIRSTSAHTTGVPNLAAATATGAPAADGGPLSRAPTPMVFLDSTSGITSEPPTAATAAPSLARNRTAAPVPAAPIAGPSLQAVSIHERLAAMLASGPAPPSTAPIGSFAAHGAALNTNAASVDGDDDEEDAEDNFFAEIANLGGGGGGRGSRTSRAAVAHLRPAIAGTNRPLPPLFSAAAMEMALAMQPTRPPTAPASTAAPITTSAPPAPGTDLASKWGEAPPPPAPPPPPPPATAALPSVSSTPAARSAAPVPAALFTYAQLDRGGDGGGADTSDDDGGARVTAVASSVAPPHSFVPLAGPITASSTAPTTLPPGALLQLHRPVDPRSRQHSTGSSASASASASAAAAPSSVMVDPRSRASATAHVFTSFSGRASGGQPYGNTIHRGHVMDPRGRALHADANSRSGSGSRSRELYSSSRSRSRSKEQHHRQRHGGGSDHYGYGLDGHGYHQRYPERGDAYRHYPHEAGGHDYRGYGDDSDHDHRNAYNDRDADRRHDGHHHDDDGHRHDDHRHHDNHHHHRDRSNEHGARWDGHHHDRDYDRHRLHPRHEPPRSTSSAAAFSTSNRHANAINHHATVFGDLRDKDVRVASGRPYPPALASMVCNFYVDKGCKKGDTCSMVHLNVMR